MRTRVVGGSEALTPNYLTVNPDGSIGADFTGHVHAQGLDLDAGTTTTPPDTDRVRWLRTSDGAAIASLYADEALFHHDFGMAIAGDATHTADLALTATGANAGNQFTGLHVHADIDGTSAVDITASSQPDQASVRVIDALGASSFLQLGATGHRAITIGDVATTGAINWQLGGFTVTKNAVGDFTITGLPTANPQPFVALTNVDPAGVQVTFQIVAKGATSFRFQMKNLAGALTDVGFQFAAIT